MVYEYDVYMGVGMGVYMLFTHPIHELYYICTAHIHYIYYTCTAYTIYIYYVYYIYSLYTHHIYTGETPRKNIDVMSAVSQQIAQQAAAKIAEGKYYTCNTLILVLLILTLFKYSAYITLTSSAYIAHITPAYTTTLSLLHNPLTYTNPTILTLPLCILLPL